MLRDVGDPQTVGDVGGELTLYQVGIAGANWVTLCVASCTSAMDTDQTRLPHKPSDPLPGAGDLVPAAQFGMDTRSTVDATALGMDSLDPLQQFSVSPRSLRWNTLTLGIVAARGNA